MKRHMIGRRARAAAMGICLLLFSALLSVAAPPASAQPGTIFTVVGDGGTTCAIGTGDTAFQDTDVDHPRGVVVDPTVSFGLIADTDNHRILKVNAAGTVTQLAGSIDGSSVPDCLGGDSGVPGDAFGAKLSSPGGVALSGNSAYIADTSNNRILKIDDVTGPDPQISLAAGNGAAGCVNGAAASAEFNRPSGVFVDPSNPNRLYIADKNCNAIRRVDFGAAGDPVTTVAGTLGAADDFAGDGGAATSAKLKDPQGVTLDPSGRFLVIADTFNNRIRFVDLTTGIIDTILGTGGTGCALGSLAGTDVDGPVGLAIDPTVTFGLIADTNNHRIVRADLGGTTTLAGQCDSPGFAGENVPATGALLDDPFGVTIDPTGSFAVIADTDNNRVRVVQL